MKAGWGVVGQEKHEVEVSMLAYGRGVTGSWGPAHEFREPGGTEPQGFAGWRAAVAVSRGYNRCLVITPGSLLGRVTLG